ncbi:MAG TPA: YceH family protein [Solirubrobacteraceae bacterium]|jgi:hypothetical protein|nr:YceH family protein [Solirubrobacteraceae bacterium]
MSVGTASFAGLNALSDSEQRVLGCLLEKHRTTPDAYPLSLNALRLACNQSTNRDPVVDYDEQTVRDALHRLERKGLVRLASGAGSRASKYRHLLSQALPLTRAEEALLCVLLLRGAQTPGELKQRSERMHRFDGIEELGTCVEAMIERGLVERLTRRPGQKEERYAHLLGAEDEPRARAAGDLLLTGEVVDEVPHEARMHATDGFGGTVDSSLLARVEALEREVESLRAAVRELLAAAGGPS